MMNLVQQQLLSFALSSLRIKSRARDAIFIEDVYKIHINKNKTKGDSVFKVITETIQQIK